MLQLPIEPSEQVAVELGLMDICLHILGGATIHLALLAGIILLVTTVVG